MGILSLHFRDPDGLRRWRGHVQWRYHMHLHVSRPLKRVLGVRGDHAQGGRNPVGDMGTVIRMVVEEVGVVV